MVWIFIIMLIIAGLVGMYMKKSNYPMTYIQSKVDNERYLVRNLPDAQEAADRLARVREKLVRLRKVLQQKYNDKPFVQLLVKNCDLSADKFSESTPDASYTSYSVNKGEKVYMCLRQRDEAESLVPENILTFVALHEMAHIGTSSIGHNPDFWNHFSWLITQAEELGVYQYQDFKAHPVAYCGVKITDSPTYKGGVEDGLKLLHKESDKE
jgi:hypothetical protein